MNSQAILEVLGKQLAILFALAGLGYGLGKLGLIRGKVLKIMGFSVTDLCMPALFFISTLAVSQKALQTLPFSVILGVLVDLIGLAIAWLVWPWKQKYTSSKGTFLFLVAIGNSSFLPLPLGKALWGQESQPNIVAFVFGNNLILFSLGLGLMSGWKKSDIKGFLENFAHPQVLAVLLAMALRWTSKMPPGWVLDGLEWLSRPTIPLAMLVMGAILAQAEVKSIENKGLIRIIASAKLIWLPLCIILAFKTMGFRGPVADVAVLEATMPCLASASAYALRFGGDAILAAQASFFTTLASFFTILGWIWVWTQFL